jgi:hypothetical protein
MTLHVAKGIQFHFLHSFSLLQGFGRALNLDLDLTLLAKA